MGHTELYHKYRPASFDRVIGSEDTVAALVNMIKRGTLPHATLFTGPSGCGKTTLARLAAAGLKCNPMDLREINSSSYRGIDSIRELSRIMWTSPIGPVRVFIMDECHKLSNDAQNGALKMLEDPAPHAYFMLCTTDPERLLEPIKTRCSSMPVRALTNEEIERLIKRVCKKEGIEMGSDALDELCSAAEGSARRALVLLEKLLAIPKEQWVQALKAGVVDNPQVIDLCRSLIQKKPWKRVAALLKALAGDPEGVRMAVLGYARAVLLSGRPDKQAYFVIQAFSSNFWDSKEAGLAAACFEAIHGE